MYERRVMAKAFTAAMLLALSVVTTAAAQTTGIVTGAVNDPSGARTPGATVVLINEAQGTKSTPVVTNGEGVYTFPTVIPGTYTVEVSLSGFGTFSRKGVAVRLRWRSTRAFICVSSPLRSIGTFGWTAMTSTGG